MTKADAVVIGAGPAGSTAALYLRRFGFSVVVVEKDEFPRFRIGESLTGDAARILEDLELADKINAAGFPNKKAVRVFGQSGRGNFEVRVASRNEQGELTQGRTWQVSRSEFDTLLLSEARSKGAGFIQGEATGILGEPSRPLGIIVRTSSGETVQVEAPYVLDASGPSAFLSRKGVASKKHRENYDNQVAVFSQVTGATLDTGDSENDTLIFYRAPREWAWLIPLGRGEVSVGVVVPAPLLRGTPGSADDYYLNALKGFHPELTRRLASSKHDAQVRTASSYSFAVEDYCGTGFFCLGDSKGFIDPVFSFGVSMGMKDGELAAQAIKKLHQGQSERVVLDKYKEVTGRGFQRVRDFIDAFWGHPLGFSYLVHSKYPEEATDLFAGRVFSPETSKIMNELSELASHVRRTEQASAHL